jgi:hypothetical protein
MEGDLFHSPCRKRFHSRDQQTFFVNVSFEEPKDFSCVEEEKNPIVGGKNMPVLTAGFTILDNSIFPKGN